MGIEEKGVSVCVCRKYIAMRVPALKWWRDETEKEART